jgi:hypothetical protein
MNIGASDANENKPDSSDLILPWWVWFVPLFNALYYALWFAILWYTAMTAAQFVDDDSYIKSGFSRAFLCTFALYLGYYGITAAREMDSSCW